MIIKLLLNRPPPKQKNYIEGRECTRTSRWLTCPCLFSLFVREPPFNTHWLICIYRRRNSSKLVCFWIVIGIRIFGQLLWFWMASNGMESRGAATNNQWGLFPLPPPPVGRRIRRGLPKGSTNDKKGIRATHYTSPDRTQLPPKNALKKKNTGYWIVWQSIDDVWFLVCGKRLSWNFSCWMGFVDSMVAAAAGWWRRTREGWRVIIILSNFIPQQL